MRRDRAGRTARAFAPGHVTGFFAPAATGRDPRARGSVGAGVVLELGVVAEAAYRPGARRTIRLAADTAEPLPISRDVTERLLGARTGRLDVRLVHQLPIGQGFGMSAAGALATALAVGRVLGEPTRRSVETAHLADLFGGGGLGGVAAILRGGLEIRRSPGIPPWGSAVHRPFPSPLWVGVTGARIPSPGLLRDPDFLDRVRRASAGALTSLESRPTPLRWVEASEAFSDRLGLAPSTLRALLRSLRRAGIPASQAMFGRSFFALPSGPTRRRALVELLERHRLRGVELRAASRGAHLVTGAADSLEKAF